MDQTEAAREEAKRRLLVAARAMANGEEARVGYELYRRAFSGERVTDMSVSEMAGSFTVTFREEACHAVMTRREMDW